MDNINAFLTCPKCHRMYETRVTRCEPPCNYECPVHEVMPAAEAAEVIAAVVDTAAPVDTLAETVND